VLTLNLSQYIAPQRGARVARTPEGRGLTASQSRSLGAQLGGRRSLVLNFPAECIFMRINDGVHSTGRASGRHPPSRVPGFNAVFRFAAHKIALFCITTRDIAAGEELFVEYGTPYWVSMGVKQSHRGRP